MENIIKDIVLEDDSTNIDLEYNNLMELANQYIDKLPPKQKSVFLMSITENITNENIAKKLNISRKTVDNHLSNARAFLKKSFVDGKLISALFFSLFLR